LHAFPALGFKNEAGRGRRMIGISVGSRRREETGKDTHLRARCV
jgi:hypothetical protein